MKRCSTVTFRRLEIINLCDGARLGYACDFEFDCEDARLLAMVVHRGGGFLGLGREEDLIIPWENIECIGEDTVLVRLSQKEMASCCISHQRVCGKRRF